jgi:hypothetical protein
VVHAILGVSRVQSFEANLLIFADFGHSQDRIDAVFSLAHLCRLRERDFGQGIYMIERDAMGKNMGTHGNYGQHLKRKFGKVYG